MFGSCWPFCLKTPPSPPASSVRTQNEDAINQDSTVAPSVQEETPTRVAHATRQTFQSPYYLQHSPSRGRPLSVIPMPTPSPGGQTQTIAADGEEAADHLSSLIPPRGSSLRHYLPIQLSPLGPAAQQDNAFSNPVLPNAVDDGESRNSEYSKERHKRRAASASSGRKEESRDEEFSAEQIMALISEEQRPGIVIPEEERRTRLIFTSDTHEIYQVFPNKRDESPIFFDLKTQASTPNLHGVSQGPDD